MLIVIIILFIFIFIIAHYYLLSLAMGDFELKGLKTTKARTMSSITKKTLQKWQLTNIRIKTIKEKMPVWTSIDHI